MRISMVAAVVAAFAGGAASAQEVQPGIFQVMANSQVKIDRHGTCRIVKNGGSNPVMVPTKTAQEWSSGPNSFLTNITMMDGVSVSNCIVAPSADSIYNSDCLSLDSLDDGYLDVCYYMGKMETLLADAVSNGYETFRIDYEDLMQNASSATTSYNMKYWHSSYFGVINGGIDGQKVVTTASFQKTINNDRRSAYVCGVLADAPGVYWGTNDNGFVPAGGYSISYSVLCE